MAVVALGLGVEGRRAALGILGGGLLAAVSYRGVKAGVDGLTALAAGAAPPSPARPKPARIVAVLVLRYALLTLLAYVMIARLRLHPLGLLAGASSVVAAVSIEAVRLLMKKS